MMHRKILLGCFVFLFAISARADGFPNPRGYVNDFAGLLSVDVSRSMERQLTEYEKTAGIEIAVVTVSSLGGVEAGDYAVRLGNAWGVGNKRKDNGVLFLVAPNERAMFIATGYGIEPDLPDGLCGEIIRVDITPHFKHGNMEAGITSGVNGIVRRLGNKPFAERIRERQERAEKEQQESERRSAAAKEGLFISIIVLICASPFVVFGFWITRRRRLRAHIAQLQSENKRDLDACMARFVTLANQVKQSQTNLKVLQRDYPESVWESAKRGVDRTARLSQSSLEELLGFPLEGVGKSDDLSELEKEHATLAEEIHTIDEAFLLLSIDGIRENVERAKQRVPQLFRDVRDQAKRLTSSLDVASVTEDTRRQGRLALEKFMKMSSPPDQSSKEDWLAVAASLEEMLGAVRAAQCNVDRDVAFAKRAETEGPMLLEKIPALIEKADRSVRHEDVDRQAKLLCAASRKSYESARVNLGRRVGWVTIFTLLLQAEENAKKALRQAKDDIDAAETAREAARRRRREEDERRAAQSYAAISASSSGSRDDDRGFGGFGGGSFGGGGAGGKW